MRNKVAEFETVAAKHKVSESDHKRFKLLCDNVNDLKSRKHNAFKCNIGGIIMKVLNIFFIASLTYLTMSCELFLVDYDYDRDDKFCQPENF